MRAGGLVVAATLALAACTATGGAGRAPDGEDRAVLDADEARDALRPSMALISTPESTGSAVLLDDGYLITDAHVVDPYATVDVTFAGAERIEAVPVVEVDLVADLAVVGPVDVDAPAAAIVAPEDDAEDGRAFLVGFPGDQDPDDPELEVTEGHLEGLLRDDRWDLAYVRSTTPIRDGQSGGALVDGAGRMIGISGLSDEDGTALSVSGGDVRRSVDRLLDGDGSVWHGIDPGDGATTFDEYQAWDGDKAGYYVVPTEDEQRVEVTVEGASPRVAVSEPGDSAWPWAISATIDPDDDADGWYLDAEEVDDGTVEQLEQIGPSTWAVDLGEWEAAVITVAVGPGESSYAVRTSIPVVSVSTYGEDVDLEVGEPERIVMDTLDDGAWGSVELEAGTTYEVAVRTPSGDASWTIGAEDDEDDTADADDGGGGIFDLDAVDTFTPSAGGSYWLDVYELSDGATEVEIEISEA